MGMLILIAALLANSSEAERFLYSCKSSKLAAEFSLVYRRIGTKIDNVEIVHWESPRLPPDSRTRWRGRQDGERVHFEFQNVSNGFSTGAVMELVPEAERPGHFRLSWSSTSGGGHVYFEEEEQTASCEMREGA